MRPLVVVYVLQNGRVKALRRFSSNAPYWIERLSQGQRVVGTLVRRSINKPPLPVEGTE